GVSVVLKGTSKGTTTDAGGIFDISVPSAKGITLVFSFVGVATQEVPVGNQSSGKPGSHHQHHNQPDCAKTLALLHPGRWPVLAKWVNDCDH
ncbi:MAG: hypothetical protein EOO61_18585, partial [Hymenobacter sp.]